MNEIIVVGSLNMDLVINTPRVPKLGETIIGSNFITVPGGKGANQAVSAAKLGGNVLMVGCVGNDMFGQTLRENLKSCNINIQNTRVIQNVSTGVAVITVCGGDNSIILGSGANFKIDCSMIDEIREVIMESYMVMIQLEIPQKVVEYVIDIAHKNKVKVLLNPAPARQLSDELLCKVDIFTPNESECEIITGIPIKSIEDARSAVNYLQKKGIQNVIITMGKNGVVYNSGEAVIHKMVTKVRVVDTTAAGDSFSGAIAVALSEGKTIDEAVNFGNKVGTLTVMKMGAQISIPTRQEIENFDKIISQQ